MSEIKNRETYVSSYYFKDNILDATQKVTTMSLWIICAALDTLSIHGEEFLLYRVLTTLN